MPIEHNPTMETGRFCLCRIPWILNLFGQISYILYKKQIDITLRREVNPNLHKASVQFDGRSIEDIDEVRWGSLTSDQTSADSWVKPDYSRWVSDMLMRDAVGQVHTVTTEDKSRFGLSRASHMSIWWRRSKSAFCCDGRKFPVDSNVSSNSMSTKTDNYT